MPKYKVEFLFDNIDHPDNVDAVDRVVTAIIENAVEGSYDVNTSVVGDDGKPLPEPVTPEHESEYPECEKLSAIHDQSQAIGEFMEWLQDTHQLGLASCHTHSEKPDKDGEDGESNGCYMWEEHEPLTGKPYMTWVRTCGAHNDELVPTHRTVEDLMYEFFEIDPMVIEQERRTMLTVMRTLQEKK